MTGAGGLGLNRAVRSRWVGSSAVLPSKPDAPQWLKYVLLTVSMLGVQLVWSCEMAQASPYLLSLGLSKAWMSVVFLAGPLSGLIVQPLVGALSDSCKSSLGRRRPYIIAGCIASGMAVMLFGWTREVAAIVSTPGGSFHTKLTIALAVFSVYVIDFSVNVIQAMDRSLLVDIVPAEQQPDANAWAGRMFGIGAVFAYFIGGVDLVWVTRGFLGDEQLKVLTIFTTLFLFISHAITCFCVQERVLIEQDALSEDGLKGALAGIWSTLRTIPRPVQQVFNIQFTAWIGWFPVLFFATTWVAEMHVISLGQPDLGSAPVEMREEATRLGTRAMLYHSCISLAVSVLVPPLISTANTTWAGLTRAPPERDAPAWKRFVPSVPFTWLTLPMLWTLSTTFFAALLLCSYFARSYVTATVIVALLGFCWAVTNWAPFAILGELIYYLPSAGRSLSRTASAVENAILEDSPTRLAAKSGSDHSQDKIYTDDASAMTSTPKRPKPLDASALKNYVNGSSGTPDTATSEYFDVPGSSSPSGQREPSSTNGRKLFRQSEERSRRSEDLFPPNNASYASFEALPDAPVLGDPYEPSPFADATPRSIKIRHSDSLDDDRSSIEDSFRSDTRRDGRRQLAGVAEEDEDDEDDPLEDLDEAPSGDDHAGVILGCHNIYIVLPQLLVSALSSIIFAIFAPHHSVVGQKPAFPPDEGTSLEGDMGARAVVEVARRMAEGASEGGSDAIGWVFRIGGISAAVSAWLCFRFMMRKELEQTMSRVSQ